MKKSKGAMRFKYRGKRYYVAEVDINIDGVNGYRLINKAGVIGCFIDSNLDEAKKRKTLHKLIKNKNMPLLAQALRMGMSI